MSVFNPSYWVILMGKQLNLTVLDVSGNKIPKVENLSHLTHLKEFWVRYSLSPIATN
jgi:Leucine-rich repeat (LRR) protein